MCSGTSACDRSTAPGSGKMGRCDIALRTRSESSTGNQYNGFKSTAKPRSTRRIVWLLPGPPPRWLRKNQERLRALRGFAVEVERLRCFRGGALLGLGADACLDAHRIEAAPDEDHRDGNEDRR